MHCPNLTSCTIFCTSIVRGILTRDLPSRITCSPSQLSLCDGIAILISFDPSYRIFCTVI
uniref:Uncharacterized protein n=1 Tax=Arundo donax TaxID=35708 RepID=A0A0A8ZVN7_ARUDO